MLCSRPRAILQAITLHSTLDAQQLDAPHCVAPDYNDVPIEDMIYIMQEFKQERDDAVQSASNMRDAMKLMTDKLNELGAKEQDTRNELSIAQEVVHESNTRNADLVDALQKCQLEYNKIQASFKTANKAVAVREQELHTQLLEAQTAYCNLKDEFEASMRASATHEEDLKKQLLEVEVANNNLRNRSNEVYEASHVRELKLMQRLLDAEATNKELDNEVTRMHLGLETFKQAGQATFIQALNSPDGHVLPGVHMATIQKNDISMSVVMFEEIWGSFVTTGTSHLQLHGETERFYKEYSNACSAGVNNAKSTLPPSDHLSILTGAGAPPTILTHGTSSPSGPPPPQPSTEQLNKQPVKSVTMQEIKSVAPGMVKSDPIADNRFHLELQGKLTKRRVAMGEVPASAVDPRPYIGAQHAACARLAHFAGKCARAAQNLKH